MTSLTPSFSVCRGHTHPGKQEYLSFTAADWKERPFIADFIWPVFIALSLSFSLTQTELRERVDAVASAVLV
jgi:hypothetical protein